MELSREQCAAIYHRDGPALVLAGPGSGKTTVITERTKYLIEQYGISPSNILVITFTKAAADEMKERFLHLCPQAGSKVRFGTFHSVFFMILCRAYGYTSENILRKEQKLQILKEIFAGMQIETNDEQEFLSSIEAEISKVKGDMLSLEYYHAICCGDAEFRSFYHKYQEALEHGRLLDFDDMLVYCYELLKQRPDICSVWQRQYPYILIDEFQDINSIQYHTIKLLVGKGANLFVVGDDDQSIYRFRGAKPEIMLNFKKDFPQAKHITLAVNYRCTDKIVKAAARVIAHNQKRFPKQICAVNVSPQPVQVRLFRDTEDECQYIMECLQKFHEQQTAYSDMAVLFRTNTQPRALVSKLMEYNIPFVMRDSMPNLFEHWISKNICTYLLLSQSLEKHGYMKRAQFLQVMNRPLRYISRDVLGDPVNFEALYGYYADKVWMLERLEKMEYDLRILAQMRPYAAVTFIRKGIAYDHYIAAYVQEKHLDRKELDNLLDELQESAKPYASFREWFQFMEDYARQLKEQMADRKKIADGVCLSTLHSAKGLEYKKVFLLDVNEGITPHHKAVLDADMEEERRLFYVGMTRAKEELYICAAKERYQHEEQLSRFISEIMNQ